MNSHPRRAKHVLLFSVDVLVVFLDELAVSYGFGEVVC